MTKVEYVFNKYSQYIPKKENKTAEDIRWDIAKKVHGIDSETNWNDIQDEGVKKKIQTMVNTMYGAGFSSESGNIINNEIDSSVEGSKDFYTIRDKYHKSLQENRYNIAPGRSDIGRNTLGKAYSAASLSGAKKGFTYFQDMANNYNSIAKWDNKPFKTIYDESVSRGLPTFIWRGKEYTTGNNVSRKNLAYNIKK